MNWCEIVERTRKSVVSISIIFNGSLESCGTGTIINNRGTVLTAGHVVGLVKDFSKEEISKTQILVSGEGIPQSFYRPLLNSPILTIEEPAAEIVLDVALLVPLQPVSPDVPERLKIESFNVKVGQEVIMAGYSEETPFPFDFDRAIRNIVPSESKKAYDAFLGTIKPATWKSGMVAHTAILDLGGILTGQIIHVDNGMHRGASGGPIIDASGNVVALITDRAMVSAKVLVEEKLHEFYVPSGNTFGLSISAVKGIAKRLGATAEFHSDT